MRISIFHADAARIPSGSPLAPIRIPHISALKDLEGGSAGVPQGFLGVPHRFLGVPGGSALVPTISFAPSGADGISPIIILECCTTLKSQIDLLNSFKHFEILGLLDLTTMGGEGGGGWEAGSKILPAMLFLILLHFSRC